MPQHHVARCAGSLYSHGHDPIIIDDGCIDALADAIDGDITEILGDWDLNPAAQKPRWPIDCFVRRRSVYQQIDLFLTKRVDRTMAVAESESRPPDMVVFFAQRRKDIPMVRRLTLALRGRWPNLCIAVAGAMAARFGRHLLASCPEIDAACMSQPESCLPSLAARWNKRNIWGQIPGLLYRASGQLREVRADSSTRIPTKIQATYHPSMYPGMPGGGKFRLFTLEHSEGVDHVGHYRDGRRSALRVRPVHQLRQEIIQLFELYGSCVYHMAGYHTPVDAVNDLARECMNLPFPISYSRDTHVYGIAPGATAGLYASGCRALGFTLLTGSQRTLSDFFGENWTVSDVTACFQACGNAGMFLHADFIHPIPPDDFHTHAETIRLLHRCRPDSVRLQLPQLIPGSAWYQHAAEFDFSQTPNKLESWLNTTDTYMNPEQEASVLPFSISGRKGPSATEKQRSLLAELEGFDAPIESGCQAGLIARVSRQRGREAQFIRSLERAVKTLDIGALHSFVETFNRHATATINTIDFGPPPTARKAVGN